MRTPSMRDWANERPRPFRKAVRQILTAFFITVVGYISLWLFLALGLVL